MRALLLCAFLHASPAFTQAKQRVDKAADLPRFSYKIDGKVDEVSLSDREIRGTLKEGALPASPPRTGDRVRTFLGAEPGPQVFTTTRIPGVDDSTLVKELETHKVKFRGRIETTFWRDLVFGWVIPLGVMAVIWILLMRRMGNWRASWPNADTAARILAWTSACLFCETRSPSRRVFRQGLWKLILHSYQRAVNSYQ